LILVLICVAAGCERPPAAQTRRSIACAAGALDTAKLVVLARDTLARLRARPQRVNRISAATTGGLELRTEDTTPGSLHNGGLVAFDCTGRITLVWLDGG
jgi:hypothetical protein